MNHLETLKQALVNKEQELATCGRVKPQFLVDDDDYQSNLELSWYKEELRDEIDSLKEQIRLLTPTMTRTVYPRLSR